MGAVSFAVREPTMDGSKRGSHPAYGTNVCDGESLEKRLIDTQIHGMRPLGSDWMARVPDPTQVSALTIPGTHDSAAYTFAWPFVATQQMNIQEQLNAGIRYFDLRCGIRDDQVEMVHGITYLGVTLDQVVSTMYSWLEQHSTEGLVVQIKQDREAERSNTRFAFAIHKVLVAHSDRWRVSNTTPRMSELRGRIQLFRRYQGRGWVSYGIDLTEWQDNPERPFTIYTRNRDKITIQDHYNFPSPQPLPSLLWKKHADVVELLDYASKDSDLAHWYVNFVSAYEFNLFYQLPPREIALGGWWAFKWEDGMNRRLRASLHSRAITSKRFGIVAMDFPEAGADDLIEALILSNFDSTTPGSPYSFRLWNSRYLLLLVVIITILVTLSRREGTGDHWCPPMLHACAIAPLETSITATDSH